MPTVRTHKKCNVCKELLPLEYFHRCGSSPDGKQYRCKSCNKEVQRVQARAKGIPKKAERDPALLAKGRKQCLRCMKSKRLTAFTSVSRGYGGVAAYCRPCISKYQLERRAKDPEAFRRILSAYRQGETWKIAHRGNMNKRRALKARANTGRVTLGFVRALYAEVPCYYCGGDTEFENRSMDHMTPLSRGGLHDPDNLVMACKFCNSKKGAMTAPEYQRKRDAIRSNDTGRLYR